MDFRTELELPTSAWNIQLQDRLVTLGSCFSDTIGHQLAEHKFPVSINPFGTTYHPLAIHRLLDYAARRRYPADETYLEREGISFNYDFHSSLWDNQRDGLRLKIQSRIDEVHHRLKESAVLLLTYGTAWVFERTDNDHPVANCHRMPSGLFRRKLTSVQEITESFRGIRAALQKINPKLRFILTVSPVRHVRDTLPANSVSKATLQLACHELASREDAVDYFPAFELLVDDLRDYRFYKEDLIHPSDMAEAYIWTKFRDTYFAGATLDVLAAWNEVRQALAHRPFHPGSDAHAKFITSIIQKLERLQPHLDVVQEIEALQAQRKQPA